MFIKSFISILIVTSSFILAIGQTTPEAKKEREKERSARAFAFSFDGDGGYLGVQTREVSKDNFASFGLREVRGVAVEKVMENSPAASAGIQNNDVIVRFNGEDVTSTRKLSRMISEVAPDHQVALKVLRDGHEKDITATLGKRQMSSFENGNFSVAAPGMLDKLNLERRLMEMPEIAELPKGEMPQVFTVPPAGEGKNFLWRAGERRQIGISVYPVTKQLGERYGVDGGLLISSVRDDSPAARAGLKAGDVITEIDGKSVKNNLELMRAISDKKEGDVTLTIMRDKNRQTMTVTPEAAKDGGFVFQTDSDDNGLMPTPAAPGAIQLTRPVMPTAPMAIPSTMTLVRPGRVL